MDLLGKVKLHATGQFQAEVVAYGENLLKVLGVVFPFKGPSRISKSIWGRVHHSMPDIDVGFLSKALSTLGIYKIQPTVLLSLWWGHSYTHMAMHLQFKGSDSPWKCSEHVWKMNPPVLSRALLIGHCGKGFIIITLKISRNMGIQK